MIYDLPESVDINGTEYRIRSDYRAVLDIITALNDSELSGQERGYILLSIFYPDWKTIPPDDVQEAVERCYWFINGGQDETHGEASPRLVDWSRDFQRIVAPVNRVLGCEIRAASYLHWWSFLSAYMEIGDCLFAQIVNIRNKLAWHRNLDKAEKEFYRRNREMIDIRQTYTREDEDILQAWTGGK